MVKSIPKKTKRPLAMALIDERYCKRGLTTRIVVLPEEDSGMPEGYIRDGHPVPLDLLSNRPLNLVMDDEGLEVDLGFGAPPVRCHFRWRAVLAVQDVEEDLVGTVVMAVLLEDSEPPEVKSVKPTLKVVGEDEKD